jgi:hypothetical protein
MKNLNYKIQDRFQHHEFGVIVSIASPELDELSDNKIKNLIGDCIAILDTDSQEKTWVKVFDISISNSIIDKKNISISLGNSIELSEIKPNSNIILTPIPANTSVSKY